MYIYECMYALAIWPHAYIHTYSTRALEFVATVTRVPTTADPGAAHGKRTVVY